MSERLKRRQKSSEEANSKPPAAPLQPAYFDSKAPQSKPMETESQPEFKIEPEHVEPAVSPARPASKRSRQSQGSQQASDASERGHSSSGQLSGGSDRPSAGDQTLDEPKTMTEDGRPRRRRRGRGGRGRSQGGASRVALPVGNAQIGQPTKVSGAAPLSSAEGSDTSAPTTSPRPSKGIVVLAIGLPGSGKSSWFKRHNIAPLSSDLLRALLFDDPNEQRFQDLVFSNLRSMLKARLIARRPINYVDATNLSPHERHGWIKLANDYGYEPQAVFFDVPLEVCLERNQRRERVVDEAVMRRMSSKLKPPTFEEGFKKITMVRVKSKDKE
ncbi:MAG: AAA family ATPase [Acidobacteriota bacterium]|nr:AAA family ATPase [Acidobacteriota bacterium]